MKTFIYFIRIELILIILICISINLFAQGINNLWLMGHDCCQPHFSGMNLNFSSGNLVIDTVHRNMNFNCTNGEISDKNGNLLFYSNGIYIANSLDDTMQNGSGLNPSLFTTNHTALGLTIPQANLVIPFPNDSMKYYLFHETSDDEFQTYATYYLYYSIIDMSLNNGLGMVIQKNNILIHDSLIEGRLTACKHANGRDWWIISHKNKNSIMHKFLVTPDGVQGPFDQDLQTYRDTYFGQCVFSQQGDKFAYYEPYGDLDIFDFDRCTGNFSNRVHIDINDSTDLGGAAFSLNGRYLYIPSSLYLYQFDMWSSNIDSSKVLIDTYDGFLSPTHATFYLAQLAPDNKIYINCGNGNLNLHVINYPDSAGLACGFCQHCVQLPAYNAFTIPNFPNYFLGAEQGSVCDSLIGVPAISGGVLSCNIFPNPARDVLYITQNKNELIKSLIVCNSIGQVQQVNYSSVKNGEYLEVNISSLPSGIYYIELLTDQKSIVKKIVKE